MAIRILNIAYHKNGVSGAPFHAVLFRDAGPEGGVKLAVVFDSLHHVAVLDVAGLAAGDIAFGSNSWRGDVFEVGLRRAVRRHTREAEAQTPGRKGARS